MAQCPRCQHPVEDKHHIITCPAPSALLVWQTLLSKLHKWLDEQLTLPELAKDLIRGLHQWHNAASTTNQAYPRWLAEQQKMGWSSALDGWLSLQWQYKQDQFWSRIHSRKSSKQWTAELIKKLWDIAWDMWEHQNDALHHSQENQQNILESAINDKITQFYESGIGILPRDTMWLMEHSLEAQLAQSVNTKFLWVESVEVAILRKAQHEKGAMVGEQRLMCWFLGLE